MEGHISHWMDTSDETSPAGALIERNTADVVVIGGGFTGLSLALHGARAGLDVQVIEARTIGYGGSGRNAGLLNAGLWLRPAEVERRLGADIGPRLVAELGEAPAYVMHLIETHQIRCGLTRTGTVHAAHSRRAVAELARRAEDWQRLGAPVRLLDRDEVASLTGFETFHAGLVDARAGTINPAAYALGLARAARDAGARIATGLRVDRLTRDGAGWRAKYSGGEITARNVVLATNAYTDSLWPGLERLFHRIHYTQVPTCNLGDRIAGILRERQGVWTTAPIMTSVRRDEGDRLVLGTMGGVMGSGGAATLRWARRELARLLPELGEVEFERPWHGQIAMTADHLPRILRLDDGAFAVLGYNGRGIAPGTWFGKAMAEFLASGDPGKLPLPLTSPKPEPLARVKEMAFAAAFGIHQLARGI